MPDPTTGNRLLAVPTRGSDPGIWDVPANGNTNAIDGMFGGVQSIALSNAPVTLTAPSGAVSPGAGPTQSQNALLRFSGTLTANCTVTVPLPGYYIAHNLCGGTNSFSVILSTGGGSVIGLPPGKMQHVFSDGTNMFFVNMPDPGSYWDYAGQTIPPWISACSLAPWLLCNGQAASQAAFATLFGVIGTAFGNPGGGNFNVPDLQNRVRVPLGTRLTQIAGNTLGANGGQDTVTLTAGQMPLQATGNESGTHTHPVGVSQSSTQVQTVVGGGILPAVMSGSTNTGTESAPHSHQVGNVSPAGVVTLQPTLVSGLTFIKT